MKVTARDISALVKDTQVEMMRKRSSEPKDSLIDALILDEMQKMQSLLEGGGKQLAEGSDGASSLDPSAFVDTSGWAGEMGLASQKSPALAPRGAAQRQTRPPANRPRVTNPPPSGGGEVESLEQMLEPDRTGVHNKPEGGLPWLLIIGILVVLAAGAAVAVVMM
jgi:hypothetical protein